MAAAWIVWIAWRPNDLHGTDRIATAAAMALAILAPVATGFIVGARWPAWVVGNAVGIALVLTGALWVVLYRNPGSDVNPTDWFWRSTDAIVAVVFALVWAGSSVYGARRALRP